MRELRPQSLLRILPSAGWILTILPPLAIAYFCFNGPEIPQNDYWGHFFRDIYTPEGFSPLIADWTRRHGNHLWTGTFLVYALNLFITKGSNFGLALASWFFGACILAMLSILHRKSFGPHNCRSRHTLDKCLLQGAESAANTEIRSIPSLARKATTQISPGGIALCRGCAGPRAHFAQSVERRNLSASRCAA